MAGELKQSAVTLFNNPILSDVKIKQVFNGSTREYFGHKAILCAQSKFFMKAFTGNFKEASDNEIELHDDDPEAFKFALEFMYTLDYSHDQLKTISRSDQTKQTYVCMDIYTIADKYDITRLTQPAMFGLRDQFDTFSDTEYPILKAAIKRHYNAHTSVSSIVGKEIATLVATRHQGFTRLQDFHVILETYPIFAADLAIAGTDYMVFEFCQFVCVYCDRLDAYNAQGHEFEERRKVYCSLCGKGQSVPN